MLKKCKKSCVALRVGMIFLFSNAIIVQAEAPRVPGMGACDLEWERIKGIEPLDKKSYELLLQQPPEQGIPRSIFKSGEADYYYYLARIPFVIGDEDSPSIEQRDQWLQKASDQGHKAAKAALMKLRYLGVLDPRRLRQGLQPQPLSRPQATRFEYLQAAREAAEAGDPEFAAVMMDTALNINRYMHCQPSDAMKSPSNIEACDPQIVTKISETRKWAEISARGGHPEAKRQLCRKTLYGTFSEQGFSGGAEEAFSWCFATTLTACMAKEHVGLVASMYERGVGVAKRPDKASEIRKLSPLPLAEHKQTIFPLTSR